MFLPVFNCRNGGPTKSDAHTPSGVALLKTKPIKIIKKGSSKWLDQN
jgi:hypothetical protein